MGVFFFITNNHYKNTIEENQAWLSDNAASVDQAILDVPAHFVKTVYTVQVSSDSATNLRNLVERLMSEERVWNIPTFTYSRSGEGSYSGSFTYELPYYTTEPEPEETVEEVSEDEESDD